VTSYDDWKSDEPSERYAEPVLAVPCVECGAVVTLSESLVERMRDKGEPVACARCEADAACLLCRGDIPSDRAGISDYFSVECAVLAATEAA
jgi:hypothetical protein